MVSYPFPLSLVVNIHLIIRLDLDGALEATKVLVVASVAASDTGGSRPITIPIPSDGSGGSGTVRGDSGGGTVLDAYISPYSKVSSEKNST